ncbi:MAG: FAD-binding oxidoreductase [Acidobacteriaceae bacterium]|nr:FAD-binding oxidoreductase [Acidobacteriaceae bacterium]
MAERGASVIIIGAGIVGASIAYHLSVRGCTDVLILEKAETEVTGSTARSAAGVRHQFSTEINIRLSLYSIEQLQHFNERVGGHADLKQVGYLLLVNNAETWTAYQKNVGLQNSFGVRSRAIAPDEVPHFIPGTRIDDLLGATYCPDDGYCNPHGIATGYLARAKELGVRLKRRTPATGIRKTGDRVTAVETPDGVFFCEVVINAAGAWAGQVGTLAGLNIPVTPYRRCVYMTEPFSLVPNEIPLTIDVGSDFYMRKEGQKVLFGLSNLKEPPGENLAVDWEWLDTVMDAGIARFPMLQHAGLAPKNCWAGLYEITPDHHPILGFHPELPNYVDASGFSGHGVMHSPATGMLIAEEILDGRAHTINIDELRIARFKNQTLPGEANVF